MKKLLVIITIAAFVLSGCSDGKANQSMNAAQALIDASCEQMQGIGCVFASGK